MRHYFYILTIFVLISCNSQNEGGELITSKDSFQSIHGSWGDHNGEAIWDIRHDSIFYYTDNRSYYYFIHGNDMIVLYKNGPYYLKDIRVNGDTLFFKTGELNAMTFKTKNKKIKFNRGDNESINFAPSDSLNNALQGEWGYKNINGLFSWIFSKDSIKYIQLNKPYFYVQHHNNVIVLMEDRPILMKDIFIKSDTMYFTTQENVLIKALKIKH